MTRPVFVVSTGRTGTTFLAESIQRLGGTAAHEPGPRWLRLASNAYVAGDLTHQRAIEVVHRARSSDKRHDVEASCLIYGLVAPILDAIPEAYVVHLVRDPRTYVRSAMNWGVHRRGGRPLNLLPYRRLALPHISGRSLHNFIAWARRDQFARLCWTWRAMNTAIAQQGEGRGRFTTIRMEDLFDPHHGYPGFRRILELARIDIPDSASLEAVAAKKINAAPRQSFPPWKDWSPGQLRLLLDECGELAARYGYPLDAEINRVLEARYRLTDGD